MSAASVDVYAVYDGALAAGRITARYKAGGR